MNSEFYFQFICFLLTIMFFLAGFNKINPFNKVALGLQKRVPDLFKKLPFIIFQLAILLVILLEIIAPTIIMIASFNKKYSLYAFISALLLTLFTIIATLLYHFPPSGMAYYPFVSNITTCGGLLLLSKVFYERL